MNSQGLSDPNKPIIFKALDLFFNAGVPSMILFLVGYAIWSGWRPAVELIQVGYDRHTAALQTAFETQDKTMERVIEQWKDDRRLMMETMKVNQGLLRQVEEHLKERDSETPPC